MKLFCFNCLLFFSPTDFKLIQNGDYKKNAIYAKKNFKDLYAKMLTWSKVDFFLIFFKNGKRKDIANKGQKMRYDKANKDG
jgi:hypothetical protein